MLNDLNTIPEREQINGATSGLAGNVASRPLAPQTSTGRAGYLRRFLANRRMGSLLLYTMAALGLAALCVFGFNALEQETEFAIAVMGSLIGGFLGAMLAAALIVDIYLPKNERGND